MSRILKPGGRAVAVDLLPHDREDFSAFINHLPQIAMIEVRAHVAGFGDPEGPCLESWTALAGLATATNRVRLGPSANVALTTETLRPIWTFRVPITHGLIVQDRVGAGVPPIRAPFRASCGAAARRRDFSSAPTRGVITTRLREGSLCHEVVGGHV